MATPTVAIIGSTGKTGKWALKGALQRGYRVRVLVRAQSKFEALLKELLGDGEGQKRLDANDGSLSIVCGNVTDAAKLRELLGADTDVVMSFLGMVKPPEWIVSPGVEAVAECLKKMTEEGPAVKVPKFITMSSIGLNESRSQAYRAWSRCITCLTADCMLKACFADMKDAELQVEEARKWSGAGDPAKLNIIIARATVLADKKGYLKDYRLTDAGAPIDGVKNYRCVQVGDNPQGKLTFQIDRQHVAEFFLDLAVSKKFDGKNVSVFERTKKDMADLTEGVATPSAQRA
mmetsp:Transcript_31639/g.90816  ORF Transcript_31639/g.90816 Transcript_31639/m.90816 type:complete len:290 (-) Transcript_31639:92-961(-)